jgi:predicted lipoprotein with Yx(FWY)xxD motif
MKKTTAAVLGIATLFLTAACSSNSSPQAQSTPTSPATSGVKLTAQSVPQLGKVLVDASGMTVYTDDQETSGQIACDATCTRIWLPVTVPAGSKPVAGPGITAHVGTISRSDGQAQVTVAGDPLYVFSLDTAPGATGGNGVTDSFGSTSFNWHAVAPSGGLVSTGSTPAPTPSPSNSSSNSTGGSYRY